jgi:chromosome partitioning protein
LFLIYLTIIVNKGHKNINIFSSMTQEAILDFLSKNPSLSLKSLEREANIPEGTIYRASSGKRDFNEAHIAKLEPVLRKYGFRFLTPCRAICFVNLKGGVAKTTSVVNISAALARLGKKVLVVDFDSQGNASSSFGFHFADVNVYHFLKDIQKGNKKEGVLPIHTIKENLDLLPSDIELSSGIDEFNGMEAKFLLRKALAPLKRKYDFILIDVGPGQGALLQNALIASDEVIIPVEPEPYTYKGMNMLLDIIETTKNLVNDELSIRGILYTKFDARLSVHKAYIEEISRRYGYLNVFDIAIHLNTDIKKSQHKAVDIFEYSPDSNVALQYMQAAKLIAFKKQEVVNG